MSKLIRPNGRPKWQPDVKQRTYIRDLASKGYPQETIAQIVGISRATLKRRCPTELHEGALIALARIAAVAFEMGTSGNHPAMTMFLLKCRAGWSERKLSKASAIIRAPITFRSDEPVKG